MQLKVSFIKNTVANTLRRGVPVRFIDHTEYRAANDTSVCDATVVAWKTNSDDQKTH